MHRGEVVRLKARRGTVGHEQRGVRYGVILQAGDLLSLSTIIVAPTSTSAQSASFRPEITIGRSRTRVLVDQMSAVDSSRIGGHAGSLGWEEMTELDAAIGAVLGLRT